MILLYSANSEGEQIISRTSKLGDFNLKRNLSRATHGFEYVFGSSIVGGMERASTWDFTFQFSERRCGCTL